jgi:hypothetical protein
MPLVRPLRVTLFFKRELRRLTFPAVEAENDRHEFIR